MRSSKNGSQGKGLKSVEVKSQKVPISKNKSVSEAGDENKKNGFPIVGIGASAGGLEAFTQLLSKLPVDTGMAFILIQHLDPTHESMSPNILSHKTKMPVQEVRDGVRVEPNRVYVIPPNSNMAIQQGLLKLSPRTQSEGRQITIDFFFQSLAEDQRARAIGVVLSGTASDGTAGIKAIKAEGGLVFAQDPKTAKYDGMPRSAIDSGVTDFVLPPEKIAIELARIAADPYIRSACELPVAESNLNDEVEEDESGAMPENILRKIFALLKTHSQVDFSDYKSTTLKRRIERRMLVQKIKSLEEYGKFLQKHQEEVRALFSNLLIHVTEFFRDPEAFKALKAQVFPDLVQNRAKLAPIRIWVPGCSSGEEAYSIAIVLLEYLSDFGSRIPVQIFATDISERAIQKARLGVYSENIETYVSKERLDRFFEKVDRGYKINKSVRDLCLFSRHDVTCDPPFAKLDLISCRNVLIYFAPPLQKRVLPIFHYALKLKGFLLLGKSENPGGFSKLFLLLDKSHKIYSKIDVPNHLNLSFSMDAYPPTPLPITQRAPLRERVKPPFQIDAEQIAQSRYVPPSVVVNSDLEILHFQGRPAPYLEPASGPAGNHLLKMARQELQSSLRMAVHSALKQNKAVRKEDISFKVEGKFKTVNIEVIPTNPNASPKERNFVIFFEEVLKTDKSKKKKEVSKKNIEEESERNSLLQNELSELREYQQSSGEDFEATKEELTSANEELQSTNEEFQSTNEELETAKEELQSSVEELSTVNEELQIRNTELTFLGSDLNNLLLSAEIPIVIVGSDHRIRRITPKAETAFRLIQSDVGRPISDVRPNFDLDLDKLVSEVIDSLTSLSKEIQDSAGRWIRIQIKPYRTTENKIEGAVIALLDVDSLKRRLNTSEVALKYALSVADAVQLPLVVLDNQLRLKSANLSFYDYFQASSQPMNIKFFDFLGIPNEQSLGLHAALEQSFVSEKESKKFEIDHQFPKIGYRALLISAKKIQLLESQSEAILVALLDITERKRMEKELAQTLKKEQKALNESEKGNRAKDIFLATLSHELRTPLTTISLWAQMLRQGKIALDSEAAKKALATIDKSAQTQGQLINDLLDVSRIIMGKLSLELCDLEPAPIIWLALDSVRPLAAKKSIVIEASLDQPAGRISIDPIRFQQVIWNLLTNAIKFSPQGGRIDVRLECVKEAQECARITVTDFGKGFSEEFLPHIFDRFSQADSSSTRVHGGLGLGLAIVRNLVELQQGSVKAKSAGKDKGSIFTVTFPIVDISKSTQDPCIPKVTDEISAKHYSKVNGDYHTLDDLRVLLVEDDFETRLALSAMLGAYGAKVEAAGSTREALEKFPVFNPQVLISDIAMPEEDGYTLIQKIRSLDPKEGGKIPALALTAYAGEQDIKHAVSAGFQIHMTKPVVGAELINAVARLAGKRR
jgi:two-component system CheB/CheR fusion protein